MRCTHVTSSRSRDGAYKYMPRMNKDVRTRLNVVSITPSYLYLYATIEHGASRHTLSNLKTAGLQFEFRE